MFKKSIRKAAVLTSTLVAVTLLSTACGTPTPTATTGYTGTAVIKEHHRSGKKCMATVELKDGRTDTIKIGRKSVCSNTQDGTKVKFENGSYKGKA